MVLVTSIFKGNVEVNKANYSPLTALQTLKNMSGISVSWTSSILKYCLITPQPIEKLTLQLKNFAHEIYKRNVAVISMALSNAFDTDTAFDTALTVARQAEGVWRMA